MRSFCNKNARVCRRRSAFSRIAIARMAGSGRVKGPITAGGLPHSEPFAFLTSKRGTNIGTCTPIALNKLASWLQRHRAKKCLARTLTAQMIAWELLGPICTNCWGGIGEGARSWNCVIYATSAPWPKRYTLLAPQSDYTSSSRRKVANISSIAGLFGVVAWPDTFPDRLQLSGLLKR